MTRIIVAEDNVMIGMALVADLTRAGYEVVGPLMRVAPALEAAGEAPVDLALVDIDLQHGDSGVELARDLSERHGVPSLFVTGQIEQARSHAEVALGALGKPFPVATLLTAVKDALAYAAGGERPEETERGLIWF